MNKFEMSYQLLLDRDSSRYNRLLNPEDDHILWDQAAVELLRTIDTPHAKLLVDIFDNESDGWWYA